MFLCLFCIWLSEKQMCKKCRNVRDSGNSIQHWIYVIVMFWIFDPEVFSFFNLYFSSYLSLLVLFNYCKFCVLLMLWPGNRKFLSAWSEFFLLKSFWWLFIFKLKAVSDWILCCMLHNINPIRYIRHLLLQLSVLYILSFLCETVLLKVLVDCTCVQHKLFRVELQGFEKPFWSIFWHSCFLLFTIVFL